MGAIAEMYFVTETHSMPVRVGIHHCSPIQSIFPPFSHSSILSYKLCIYDSLLCPLPFALCVPNTLSPLQTPTIPRYKRVPQYLPFLKSVPSPGFFFGPISGWGPKKWSLMSGSSLSLRNLHPSRLLNFHPIAKLNGAARTFVLTVIIWGSRRAIGSCAW